MNEVLARPTLVLSGFMGTGKSSTGIHLAALTGAQLVDLDEHMAARAGQSIADIFAQQGETWFRRWERELLAELIFGSAETQARIIAVGGGALVEDASRTLALATCFVVTLRATPSTILHRTTKIDAQRARPLLRGLNPLRTIEQLLKHRLSAYSDCHLSIDTDDIDAETAAQTLQSAWRGWLVFADR